MTRAVAMVLSLAAPRPALAQQDTVQESGFAFIYGVALGSATGLYSDMVGLTKLPARSVATVGLSPHGAVLLNVLTRVGPSTGPVNFALRLRASGLEQRRFYGIGNQTSSQRPSEFYEVEQYRYSVAPALQWRSGAWRFSAGPTFDLVDTDSRIDAGIQHVIGDPLPSSLANGASVDVEDVGLMQLTQPYGSSWFALTGFAVAANGLFRSIPSGPEVRLRVDAQIYPGYFDAREAFGRLEGFIGIARPLSLPLSPVFTVQAGITKVVGDAPFFELAYLGGRSSARGLPKHRYAGDGVVYSQFELWVRLGQARLFRQFQFGILGLTDVGRVYSNGVSEGGWHVTNGGGVWLRLLPDGPPIVVTLARGAEGARIHFGAGWL